MVVYFTFFIVFLKNLILLTNFLIILKYIVIKLLLLFILIFLIYRILKAKRFKKLSDLRKFRKGLSNKLIEAYWLDTLSKRIKNGLYISIYLLVFVFGLFALKLFNINSKIYLYIIIDNLIVIYTRLSYFDKLYCFFVSILLFILIILLLKKFKQLFNKPLMARHIYMIRRQWYDNFRYTYREHFSFDSITNKISHLEIKIHEYVIMGKIGQDFVWKSGYSNWIKEENDFYFNNKILKRYLNTSEKIMNFIIEKLNYNLIVLTIFYDICYNNMIIEKIFYIYPFCHIYQLWKNISKFYDERQFQLDEYLMQYMYKTRSIPAWERAELLKDLSQYILKGFLNDFMIEYYKNQSIKQKNNKFNVYYNYIMLFLINSIFCILII